MRTTNLYRNFLLWLGVILFFTIAGFSVDAQAQADGQFCVRAYDDRNANGIRDASEPSLQSGISAELTEANGVIIASALLSASPTAAQGIICFQGLSSGQYSIIVTSADYIATTPNTMTVAIQSGDLPSVLEFGARDINALQVTDVVDEELQDPQQALERLLVAVLGAIGATLAMLTLGIIIFLLFFRRRREVQEEEITPLSDEMFRPPTETGQYYPPQE